MQVWLIILLSLHVLSAVFWAGSTFTLARAGGRGSEGLFRSQMGAAAMAILTGSLLWGLLHAGIAATRMRFLGVGGICALVAVVVQLTVARPALNRLRAGGEDPAARARLATAYRVAGVLLAITALAMGASRYA